MKRFLTVCMIAVLAVSCFAACGAAAPSTSAPTQASSQAPAASMPEYSADYGEQNDTMSESAIPFPLLTPSNSDGKKIVYTVRLWLQTTGFDAGTRKLLTTVSDMGGYLQSAYIDGRDLHYPDIERNATYTLRIPSERLADFLIVMEDNFTLKRLEQDSEDITARQEQTDTRLDDLRDQEKRLLETIKDTEDATEKLKLERQLAEVQTSISGLTASQTSMKNAVIYSTVTISLSEVIFYEPEEEQVVPFGQKLSDTINNTANGFVAFWQGFLLVMIVLLPVLLVLAVFAVVIYWIWRLYRKFRKRFPPKINNTMYNPEPYFGQNPNFGQEPYFEQDPNFGQEPAQGFAQEPESKPDEAKPDDYMPPR